jgi:hypothetical protein
MMGVAKFFNRATDMGGLNTFLKHALTPPSPKLGPLDVSQTAADAANAVATDESIKRRKDTQSATWSALTGMSGSGQAPVQSPMLQASKRSVLG